MNFNLSEKYKTYVDRFMKDGEGNWRKGSHNYPGIAIDHEMAILFDGSEGEDYQYICNLLSEDDRLRNLLIQLEAVWYKRLERIWDDCAKAERELSQLKISMART